MNEVPVTIHMKLDDNGAAYFVEVIDTDDEDEEMSPGNETFFIQIDYNV